MKPILYSYFRSSCSWRVRIALNLKKIDYETRTVNLLKNEQLGSDFVKHNPMAQLPAYVDNGQTYTQSIAILEYLDDAYPKTHSLLPKDPVKRARAREISEIINSGIQPLQNPSVQNRHSDSADEKLAWTQYWIKNGFQAVEKLLHNSAGKYCVGDEITIADCCLVPQVNAANRYKVDLTPFPLITRINAELSKNPAVIAADSANQPDSPK